MEEEPLAWRKQMSFEPGGLSMRRRFPHQGNFGAKIPLSPEGMGMFSHTSPFFSCTGMYGIWICKTQGYAAFRKIYSCSGVVGAAGAEVKRESRFCRSLIARCPTLIAPRQ